MTGFDLAAIRHGLAAAVANASGIKRVWPYVVDQVTDVPAAYVAASEPTLYNTTYGKGGTESNLVVVVVAGRVDAEASQAFLDQAESQFEGGDVLGVKDAIEADRTLGGACDTCVVERSDFLRAVQIAGVDYLARDYAVKVHTAARRRSTIQESQS